MNDVTILADINETLTQDPDASQRTLAQNSEMSLGMMNAVLKRFVERGWIAVKNLNLKKVQYCLTPKGIEEVTNRSKNYLKHSFELFAMYEKAVNSFVEDAVRKGSKRIVLVGKSNVKFLIEKACQGYVIEFCETDGAMVESVRDCVVFREGDVVVFGEDEICADGGVSILDIVG